MGHMNNILVEAGEHIINELPNLPDDEQTWNEVQNWLMTEAEPTDVMARNYSSLAQSYSQSLCPQCLSAGKCHCLEMDRT